MTYVLRGHVDSTALLRLPSLSVGLQHHEDSDIAMGGGGGGGRGASGVGTESGRIG